MIMKANKQIGFIYKDSESIDKILKDGDVVFERGFLREKTSTTLPVTFTGIGKDLKDYKVYGNTYQNSTSGKNLLPNLIESQTKSGVQITKNADGSLTLNGTSASSFNLNINYQSGKYVALENGQAYKMSLVNNSGLYFRLAKVSDNTIITSFDTPTTNKTFTSNYAGDTYAYFTILNNTTFNNLTIYPMLRLASITDDTYEPYTGGQPSPNPDYLQEIISCGDLITDSQDENYGKYKIPVNVRSENLFDKDNATILNAYIGASNSKITALVSYRTTYLKVKPNTYYTVSKNSSNDLRIGLSTNNSVDIGDILTNVARTTTGNKLTILTNNDTKTLAITYAYTTVDDEVQELNSLMVEEGSTVPFKYIPYYNETTNIYLDEPLRKIDGYSDYIDFINGKVVRNIGEIVLDGSENEWYNAGGNAPFGITIAGALITKSNNELPLIYCDSFKKVTESSSWSAYSSMVSTNNVSTAVNVLRFRYTSISGLNNFTTWLQSNNITVDYVLLTSTEESITLPNIPTLNGNNTLNIETELTPSQVYIKYKSNT